MSLKLPETFRGFIHCGVGYPKQLYCRLFDVLSSCRAQFIKHTRRVCAIFNNEENIAYFINKAKSWSCHAVKPLNKEFCSCYPRVGKHYIAFNLLASYFSLASL